MPVKPVACCVVGKDVQLSARHGTAILVENNHGVWEYSVHSTKF